MTGGAGYVGSHVARALLREGWKVRIFDLKPTKYVPEGAEFVSLDMRDAEGVRRVMQGVNVVHHLAFVQSMSRLPEATRRDIDIRGTENVLRAALGQQVDRFVYTSTIEIYGTHPPVPAVEDSPTTEPVGWYGRHKLEAEQMVWRYYRDHGLPATALRMPTICGPGWYNHRPLLSLMDWVLDGRILTVIGDGSIKGDHVHIEDVVQGYLLAGTHPKAVGEAFNISTDRTATHLEIAQALIRASGSKSRIVKGVPRWIVAPMIRMGIRLGLTELPKEQIGYVLHDQIYTPEKAMRLIGYRPRYSSAEATEALIRSYIPDREFVRHRSEHY